MKKAIDQAKKAWSIGEVPVGAVIADSEGRIISRGYNQTITKNDPTAHAEVVALRKAGKKLGNYRLLDLNIFVTLEPCVMCSMALIHARIKGLYFGAYDLKTGACGSVFNTITDERHNHRIEVEGGILKDECSNILSEFFRQRRAAHKQEKSLKRLNKNA
ncbi:MAG: tRNA adenosine(34) deaminase TadA [Succinivibrio sp.]